MSNRTNLGNVRGNPGPQGPTGIMGPPGPPGGGGGATSEYMHIFPQNGELSQWLTLQDFDRGITMWSSLWEDKPWPRLNSNIINISAQHVPDNGFRGFQMLFPREALGTRIFYRATANNNFWHSQNWRIVSTMQRSMLKTLVDMAGGDVNEFDEIVENLRQEQCASRNR